MYGGEGRIRTSEGVRRQIYSLIPLATREPLRYTFPRLRFAAPRERLGRGFARFASLPRIPGSESVCLLPSLLIADGRNRTDDLLITSQLLYQLSYIGRGLNRQNYSQATIVSSSCRFEPLAMRRHPVGAAGGRGIESMRAHDDWRQVSERARRRKEPSSCATPDQIR